MYACKIWDKVIRDSSHLHYMEILCGPGWMCVVTPRMKIHSSIHSQDE